MNKNTPLHWAAYNNDEYTVAYLLSRGAKQIKNSTKHTPVDVAGFCRIKSMIKIFVNDIKSRIQPRSAHYELMHNYLDHKDKAIGDPVFAKQIEELVFATGKKNDNN